MREDRLLTDLERLSGFTQTPGQGVTRFSWSEEDRLARAYLERELKAIDLSPWTDGIGNLRARMRGKDSSKAILAGSHFDTVRNGGAYDGTYGVIAALEVLRSFHDQGYVPDWDLEFIAFVEEEGSNFGCTCLGSKAITGQAGIADLKSLRNAQGRTAWQVLQDFGLNPEALPEQQIVPSAVAAYLEVHIEQNAVLEKNTFENNRAYSGGGALYITPSTITVTTLLDHCTFTNNSTTMPGMIPVSASASIPIGARRSRARQ